MNEDQGQIQLILPDAIERSACFRALVAGTQRVVRSFASTEDYLAAGVEAAGGIVLMRWEQPGPVGGATLLKHACGRPEVVLLVAAERLSLAESRAILRSGAYDLLPAPLDPRLVRLTVEAATGEWRLRREAAGRRREAAARLAALTPREQDILDAIAAGLGNKAIARRLELSPRTVEVHRANIMRRAAAGSIAELLRLRFLAEAGTGHMVHSGA